MHFTIYGELTDLNTFIDAERSNRFAASAIKKSETQRVADEAMVARLKPVEKYPVHITYRWYSNNKRKDIDNVAFAKKFVNDGLVVAGVLANDGRKQVSGFSDEFYIDTKYPRVEVKIESCI